MSLIQQANLSPRRILSSFSFPSICLSPSICLILSPVSVSFRSNRFAAGVPQAQIRLLHPDTPCCRPSPRRAERAAAHSVCLSVSPFLAVCPCHTFSLCALRRGRTVGEVFLSRRFLKVWVRLSLRSVAFLGLGLRWEGLRVRGENPGVSQETRRGTARKSAAIVWELKERCRGCVTAL